jgi:starch synthase (maltosyl-transferring)
VNKTTQIVEGASTGGAFHIEDIYPVIDGGRFAVKRVVGERIEIWADIYRDGNDVVAADVIWRRERDTEWRRAPMRHHSNDRWVGALVPEQIGRHVYAIEAWTDEFATWRRGFERKQQAGADIALDAIEGAGLLTKAQAGGHEATAIIIHQCEEYLRTGDVAPLLTDELKDAMADGQFRPDLTRSRQFPFVVERARAGFGAWYQMVPHSQGTTPGQHGTFGDCIARLADVEAMGFDVVCLSPIGAAEGGHDAVHPRLGTLADFDEFVIACTSRGLEVALDFAAECAPDHPWLSQHPNWFKRRPDGSIRRAEVPPNQLDDVVIPDFSSEDAGALWNALRNAVLFWIDHGIKIFRISRPHASSFRFWEWLIREVQLRYPDAIFLADAITREKPMKGLAKLGFTESSTYFTRWTQKWEFEQYLNQLIRYPECDFYRPNFFVNSLDHLPYHLQSGEAWMFKSRIALAATLSGSYGIANGFELLEHEAVPGSEKYLVSDKDEIKVRDWDGPGNIKSYIAEINRIRRENPALQQTPNLSFLPIDDGDVIVFAKESVDRSNTVVAAISLSRDVQEFWLPFGDTRITASDGERRHVAALLNLKNGERSPLDWGGIHLRIDPVQDPALLFRCLA